MAQRKILPMPLVGGTGRYFGQQFDTEQTLNMYTATSGSTNNNALITIPGTNVVYSNQAGSSTRQLYENGTQMFAVYGSQVVGHDLGLVPTPIGKLNTSEGYVAIKDNNAKQVMFVDGVNGWVYDFSSTPTFTKITDTTFVAIKNPIDIDYLDEHMFVAFGSTNQWIISNLGDAKVYDPLNFAFLTSDGNEVLRGLRIVNRRIFIFGRQVTEIWYPTGEASSFPYRRDDNSVLQYGCQATGSIAVGNLSSGKSVLVWLASDKSGNISVRVSQGGISEKISSPGIDLQMESFSNTQDARGYVFRIEGHTFYLINFIKDNATFVFDFDMQVWHEQQMLDTNKYFSICHTFFNNTHYLGHNDAAQLSVLDSSMQGNNGEGIHIKRITPIFALPTYERSMISRLIIQMRNGIGAVRDVNNINPKLFVSHSEDGGYSFSNERPVTTGKLGVAKWQAVLTGFPMSFEHVFKIESFNALRNIIEEAFVEIDNSGF